MNKILKRQIKVTFIVLLISRVNASNHTKFVSLSNQKSEIQATLINLHPNKYSQELYSEDLKIHVFKMITGKKRIKRFKKNIYHVNVNVNLIAENVNQIKSGIMINLDVSLENVIYLKKIVIGVLLNIVAKMVNI